MPSPNTFGDDHCRRVIAPDEYVDMLSLERPAIVSPNGRNVLDPWTPDPIPPVNQRHWVEYAAAPINTISSLTGLFTVPALPTTEPADVRIYLFQGIQTDGRHSIILQPVLQYGFGVNSWQIASWWANADGWSFLSTPVPVAPGDIIRSSITSQSLPGGNTWNISAIDLTQQGVPTTLELRNVDPSLLVGGKVIGGELETWGVQNTCLSELLGAGQTLFAEIAVRNGDQQLLQMFWSRQPPTPQPPEGTTCSASVSYTPTTVTLTY